VKESFVHAIVSIRINVKESIWSVVFVEMKFTEARIN